MSRNDDPAITAAAGVQVIERRIGELRGPDKVRGDQRGSPRFGGGRSSAVRQIRPLDNDLLGDHGDGMGIRFGKGLLWAIGRRGDRHQPELMGVQHRGRRRVRRALQPNPVADPAEPRPAASGTASTTDPDAAWAVKWGRAALAYYNNYLIDTPRRVIQHLRDGGGVRGPRSRRWSRVVVVSVCGTASNPHHRRDESRRGHPGLCGLSESRGC